MGPVTTPDIFNDHHIPLFDDENDYVDEQHISQFAKALVWDHEEDTKEDDKGSDKSTPKSASDKEGEATVQNDLQDTLETLQDIEGEQIGQAVRPVKNVPDKITSKSDWYPIHHKMKQQKKKLEKKVTNEFRDSIGYSLLRWPILLCVLGWISFLCVIYSIVRAYVALSEYYLTWIGQRKRLRDKLRQSKTYDEWVKNALALDHYLNLDKWSINPRFSYYDSRTIKMTISKLSKLKNDGADSELLVLLQGCVKSNFAGVENKQLYAHRYYGTKNLVEKYVKLVSECIDHITESEQVDNDTKRKFFKIVSKNYGKTALCLSGGACFAYSHFGVIKALLDNDSLPSIISGTSAGGVVAAMACTRTDEELKKLLVPQLARKITACEDPWYVWIPRFWKTGARFDSVAWAKKSNFFTKGSTTFQDAFKTTGRKLNISTVPADPHSPVILCNNITSPNCIIWSSLLASSAVPGILNPVVLMMKNPNNQEVVPFSLGNKWRDGSLRTDIPIDALNTYYNVNFTIVSQVNPHISLFFYAPKGTVGRPVAISRRNTHKQRYESFRGGFVGAAIEQLLRLEITKWLKIIKNLDLLPHILEQDWSNIWLQRFSGSITVWPRNKLKDFWYILSDPTEERMEEMLMKGQRSMFPRLLFIKHRLSIERAIERGRKASKFTNTNTAQSHFDDDSDSSDEETTFISPFENRYLDLSDDMGVSSRTVSPEIGYGSEQDQDTEDEHEDQEEHEYTERRRYTIF